MNRVALITIYIRQYSHMNVFYIKYQVFEKHPVYFCPISDTCVDVTSVITSISLYIFHITTRTISAYKKTCKMLGKGKNINAQKCSINREHFLSMMLFNYSMNFDELNLTKASTVVLFIR